MNHIFVFHILLVIVYYYLHYLLIYLFFILCCIVSYYQIKRIRNEEEANDHPNVSICVISTICFFIILIIWQFIDCILFWSGFYLDGNQMKMN